MLRRKDRLLVYFTTVIGEVRMSMGAVTHTCDRNTQETGAGGLRVQVQHQLSKCVRGQSGLYENV